MFNYLFKGEVRGALKKQIIIPIIHNSCYLSVINSISCPAIYDIYREKLLYVKESFKYESKLCV